jgi:hypothetical protein
MEKDMTDEQHSWTQPVKARPNREWTLDALEIWCPSTLNSAR